MVVAGDRDRLKQVLVNLIDNAIKYTPHGGQVTVETGMDGDMGFLTVEDTWHRHRPRHHERVFDRFYRVTPDRGESARAWGWRSSNRSAMPMAARSRLRSAPEIGSCFQGRDSAVRRAENKMAAADAAAAMMFAGS